METATRRDAMVNFLEEIGLWNDPRRRFFLPASNHSINDSEVESISEIGIEIASLIKASDCLMQKAVAKNINSGGMAFFRRTAQIGIPKNRRRHQRAVNGSFPETLKVDLVKGKDGRFYIVEIDSVNTHGLGYGVILQKLESFLENQNQQFVGTTEVLNHKPLSVIVPFRDRFHEGEWKAVSEIIETLDFHRERDVRPVDFKGKTVLDIHERLENGFQAELVEMMLAGDLKVLVPPKDSLGSKNILPLAWNSETEELLTENGCNVKSLKEYLPEAHFVSRRTDLTNFSEEDWLVKDVNSNAMKGVVSLSKHLERCQSSNFGVILQKKIEQQEQPFQFFGSEGEVREEDLYVRYVVFYKNDGTPLDCLYTATPDELTHGGVKAVMGVCSWVGK